MDQKNTKENVISAIVPAFNEEKTVPFVVSVLVSHPNIGEVIVVDDGSSDNTSKVLEGSGAKVITLEKNLGKAGAMQKGVDAAKNEVIAFFDADLVGFNHGMIDILLKGMFEKGCDMYVLIRERNTKLNTILPFLPILGGERILTKTLWALVPPRYRKGFEIETALNYYTKKTGRKMGYEVVDGLHQTIKEKKYGTMVGFYRRLVMILQVAKIILEIRLIEVPKSAMRKLFRAKAS